MKPAFQWTTRQFRAKRLLTRPRDPALAADARAEAFELVRSAGPSEWAELGLARQVLSPGAAGDPDIAYAVRSWLIARGARQLNLFVAGEPEATPLGAGPIAPSDLGAARGPVARIVSLCPSNAELLDALGCFDRVIACEDSSDTPPEVATLERLGPDLDPNLERIAELAPDLVLSSLSVPGMERIVTGLHSRGIAQLVLAPRSIDDVIAELLRVAVALDVRSAGESVAARMNTERGELVRALPPGRPTRVYLEWWPKPMFSPGADCYSNELIALAGGSNVFGDRPGASLEVSTADLVEAEPEVCFVSWCGVRAEKLDPEHLKRRPDLASLPAVRAAHVYTLDERFSGRPGPNMLEAARIMARGIRAAREG